MDLYKGMRLVAFTSLAFGTTTFVVSSWLILTNRKVADIVGGPSNETFCLLQNEEDALTVKYKHSVLFRTSVVVVIVSLVQVLSGISILASPLQGSRRRAKIWFGVNIALNLILFLCFIVPLMNTKGRDPLLTLNNEKSLNCPWSMTSARLDSFYVSVCLDFVVHFLVLVFSLMMLRYDENRDYELVAII